MFKMKYTQKVHTRNTSAYYARFTIELGSVLTGNYFVNVIPVLVFQGPRYLTKGAQGELLCSHFGVIPLGRFSSLASIIWHKNGMYH